MIKHTLIFFLFFSLIGFAQDIIKPTVYFNENLEQIKPIDFQNKVLKDIFEEQIVEKDSVIIKKLRKRYEFDSLNPTQLNQVQGLLKKYLGIENFEKNIILVYRDSLLGYSEFMSSKTQKYDHDALDVDTENKYLKRRKKYDSNQKKCKKFIKKNDLIAIYTYSEEIGFTYKPKHYNNVKIPKVIKSIFFKDIQNGSLIIKPNGQYFFYQYLTQKQLKEMLDSDWDSYIKDYTNVKSSETKRTLLFIKKMKENQRKEMKLLAQRAILKRSSSFKNGNKPRTSKGIIISPPYNCFGYANY